MDKTIMTPKEFEKKMLEIIESHEREYLPGDIDLDRESAHIEMDWLMCDLLTSMGYGAGILVFKNCPKWYA